LLLHGPSQSTTLFVFTASQLIKHRWIAFLEKTHVAIEDGLAEKIKWNIKRGRDFQNIAHMVYCCDGLEPDGEHLLPTAQKMEKWISREDPPPHSFKKNIENVLKSLWVLGSDSRYNEAFSKIKALVAPVEFVFLGTFPASQCPVTYLLLTAFM
jgi:hypothetical protein